MEDMPLDKNDAKFACFSSNGKVCGVLAAYIDSEPDLEI